MRFDIVTLFPEYFKSPLQESLIAKAVANSTIEINVVNLRDFSTNLHNQVDDTPYGGGAGMVLKADVLAACIKKLKTAGSWVILTDPAGETLSQEIAYDLAAKKHVIIVCGRYEGIDQRFKDKYVDQEISIGDYVVNGGEVASLVILEAAARLVPGVIGAQESLSEESFSERVLPNGQKTKLLEYPQYTRPEIFEDEKVPDVLLSGNHELIKKWRLEKSLEKTKTKRPDLLKN